MSEVISLIYTRFFYGFVFKWTFYSFRYFDFTNFIYKINAIVFLSYHWLFYRHEYTLWSMLNDLVRWKNQRVRLAEVIFNHVSLICCWCFGSRTWQFPYDVFLRHLRAICIAHIRFSKGNIRCCLPGIYNKLISTAVALLTKLLDIDFIIIIRR